MTQEELNKILKAHHYYIRTSFPGYSDLRVRGRKADLSRVDLSNVNLKYADLRFSDLYNVNLMGVDLRGADLSYANLSRANFLSANLSISKLVSSRLDYAVLYGANLSEADLSCSNLSRADFSSADLRYARLDVANLRDTNLRGADLSGANFRDADLRGADLRGADLSGAKFDFANLHGANLHGIKCNEKTTCFALECPEKGDFIAWKRINNVIIKLRVPSEAKRSSATTRRCRCEYAEVLELQNFDGTPYNDNEVVNYNKYGETHYKVGKIVHPDSWDEDRWNERSHGIHFFMTRGDAVRS